MHAIPTATPRRLATTLFAIGAYLHAAVGCVSSTTSPPKADVVEVTTTDRTGTAVTETIDFAKDFDPYLDHIVAGMPGHTDLVFSRTTELVLDTGQEMTLSPNNARISLSVDGTPSILSFAWSDTTHTLVMDTQGTTLTMGFGADSRAKEHAGLFVLATLAASQTDLPAAPVAGQRLAPILVYALTAAAAIAIVCAGCFVQCWWNGETMRSCRASANPGTEGAYYVSLDCICSGEGSGSGS